MVDWLDYPYIKELISSVTVVEFLTFVSGWIATLISSWLARKHRIKLEKKLSNLEKQNSDLIKSSEKFEKDSQRKDSIKSIEAIGDRLTREVNCYSFSKEEEAEKSYLELCHTIKNLYNSYKIPENHRPTLYKMFSISHDSLFESRNSPGRMTKQLLPKYRYLINKAKKESIPLYVKKEYQVKKKVTKIKENTDDYSETTKVLCFTIIAFIGLSLFTYVGGSFMHKLTLG